MADEEDVISSLPDCLLLEIISRLPTTKHAIKTSTLSKRWQHLWTFLPNLIFIESKDFYTRDHYHYHPLYRYFSFIDRTLSQCPTHVNLNKFELRFNLTTSHRPFNDIWYNTHIKSWIVYAITRNVQNVNIMLWDGGKLEKFRYDGDSILKNLCATQMKLTRCLFKNPIGAISWEKLKCLCISKGILDEDVIADILSGSPCLETLEFDECYGFSSINVTSKSVKNLVYFNNGRNKYGVHDGITINAPYILSLTIKYSKDLREILLLNVSSLIKADLEYRPAHPLFGITKEEEEDDEELLKGILQSLSHVKNITIGLCNFEVLSRLEAKGFQFFEGADYSDWVDKKGDWEEQSYLFWLKLN